MGIQGLLPLLKSITETVHIKDYAGLTVGIDALTWLHKSIYTCAERLATGEESMAYVAFCVKRLDLLLAHGVKVRERAAGGGMHGARRQSMSILTLQDVKGVSIAADSWTLRSSPRSSGSD